MKKELIGWLIWGSIFGVLYFTGWYAPVIGVIHRTVLATGLRNAKGEEGQVVDVANLNWQVEDEQGKTISITSLNGKVIFINFWATWCPPCLGELPSIQNLYNEVDFC